MTAYHLAATPPILLLIAVPTLWPWALALAAFVVIAALAAAAHHFWQGRESWRAEAERAGRERDEEREVRRRTEHAFAAFKLDLEAKGTRVVTPIRRELRSVPNEPTPIHDAVLVDAWIDHVQAWGEDVES